MANRLVHYWEVDLQYGRTAVSYVVFTHSLSNCFNWNVVLSGGAEDTIVTSE